MNRTLLTGLLLLAATAGNVQADDAIYTPEDFLKAVKAKNEEIRGAMATSEGALKRAEEGDLMTATTLFADVEYNSDGMLPVMPFFTYDSLNTQRFTLGVRKMTDFGLDAKFYYLLRHTQYVNMSSGMIPPINFYDARPTLELSQSLWANGFGRTIRAQQQATEARALAASYGDSHKVKAMLVAAENAYWGLALAHEKVEVTRIALDQALKTSKWTDERVRRNLADEVDGLQAKAAMDMSLLEMQAALDEERVASRAFNRLRSENSDKVQQTLKTTDTETLLEMKIQDARPQSDELKAAEQAQKAAVAGAAAAIEKTRPSLDLYGTYGLNGRDVSAGTALGDPFSANRPIVVVGLKFAMPLDRGLASDTAAGYRKEQMGAEMVYRQKLNDLQIEWADTKTRIAESKVRLQLTRTLVAAQKSKLALERERFKSGRTTTFFVLQSESEYAKARLAEIGAKAGLVRALTQLKLYGGTL